jgi:ribosomal peptide maturation radical SAM protein 1
MFRVALVNPPFADFNRPPIGLAQLRSVLRSTLPGRVDVTLFHLNLDFARRLGLPAYAIISNTVDAMLSGTGDWLFRAVAFPEAPDNVGEYLRRYPKTFGTRQKKMQELLLSLRRSLPQVLDEIIDRCGLDRFDLVGLTSTFQQNLACFALSRRIKERNPRVITAMGGANCESGMGRTIARLVDSVDFVFSGPALKTFPRVVGFLAEGQPERCHDVKGVFSRARLARRAGEVANEVGEDLDIDEDVPLDYDDYFAALDEKLPGLPVTPHLLFETSRGCWWGERAHCTFCGLNGLGMGYRAMRPEKVLAQFERLFRYAPRVHRFESVDNIMPREFVKDVLPKLHSPKEIFYEVKADLSGRDLEVLAAAGVTGIQPGIEALATSTLQRMRKGTTASQNVRFLKECLRCDVNPVWNLLVAFPGEGEDSYQQYCQDIPRLVHLPPPSGVHPVRFDRFSPYFERAAEYGLRLQPYGFYALVYPFDAGALADLAYYFVNEDFDAPYFRAFVKWLRPMQERVADWRARWRGRPRPELFLERTPEGTLVHDSRSGNETVAPLDDVASRILTLLMTPTPRSRIPPQLPALTPSETERGLAALDELGLVFRDGERLLALPNESRVESYTVRTWPLESLLAAFIEEPD